MFGRDHRHTRDTARDVKEELQLHRELRAADPTSPAAPSTASEAELVRLALARDRRLGLAALVQELRFDLVDSFRRLRRAPAFTLGTIGILAIGLGASTAVFGLANMMYFSALPFADADRLVRVQETNRLRDGSTQWVDSSTPTLRASQQGEAFQVAAGLRSSSAALIVDGAAARHIGVGEVGEGWSEVIGLHPAIGRMFTPDEERLGSGAGVAVISHHLWQTHFGGRADVLGKPLVFDGGSRAVIGVLPAGFRFPYEEDAWWPQTFPPDGRDLFIYARLRPGITLAAANERLAAVAPQLNRDWPAVIRGMVPQARPMRDVIVRDEDRVVILLGWSVAVLLLIVGSNVAMQLTTRIVSRERELALRAALGCGWGRQLRHLMLEAVMIFLGGAAAGIGAAFMARRLLAAALPERMATQLPMADIAMDWRVALFSVALAVVTGAVFGAISAWRTAGRTASAATAQSRAIGSRSGRRTAGALIALELALASALVGASATVGGALRQVENRDIGFSTDRLLTLQFALAGDRLNTAAGHVRVLNALEDRLRALPGVTAVGTTTVNPLCCGEWGARATPEGQIVKLENAATVNWRLVSPAFFDAMGLRVLAGRVFDAHDTEHAEPVVIIDERFAERFWPGQDAVGKRVKRGGTDSAFPWMRVVGVVSPVEDSGDFKESWYLPYLQYPAAGSSDSLHVMLRVSDVDSMFAPIRRAVGEVDPGLAIINLRTMEEVKMRALSQQRLGTGVAFLFAALGGFLALAGVYNLVAFVVAGETREMGIRLALGASPAAVMGRVVARIVRLALGGAAVGLTLAAFAQPAVIRALDAKPANFLPAAVAMTIGLLVAAVCAAAIPARRVLKLDPRDALNQ
jgi:predicted permease